MVENTPGYFSNETRVFFQRNPGIFPTRPGYFFNETRVFFEQDSKILRIQKMTNSSIEHIAKHIL